MNKNLENKIQYLYNAMDKGLGKAEKKALYVLTDIIVGKMTNLKSVATLHKLTLQTLNEMVLDRNLMCKFLTDDEYLQFLDIYHNLLRKSREKSIKFKIKTYEEEYYDLTKQIIDDILNNYYNATDICTKERISAEKYREIICNKDYIEACFGKGMYEKVQNKIAENIEYCRCKPQKATYIKSKKYIEIVAPTVEIINEYDKKRLETVCMYIESKGNVERIMEKFEIESVLPVISILINPRTKELLNEEIYSKLLPSLNAEIVLYNMDANVSVNDKKKLIDSVILSLRLNDFNIELTSKELNLPIYLLKRILTDGMVSVFYRSDVENIQKSLNYSNEDK